MKFSKFGLLGVVLGGMLLMGAEARAIEVRYTTIGTFTDSPNAIGNRYLDAASGIDIVFEDSIDDFVNVPFGVTTQTSFGTFNTTGTTATDFVSVDAGFTLDIFQTAPTEGQTQFVGTLSGRLFAEGSQAFIQFDQPLSSMIGQVLYEIGNADRDADGVFTPGRVNLAPPSTNEGETTVVGFITVIPEPSAIVLVGMGAVAPLGLALRRRMKVRAAN